MKECDIFGGVTTYSDPPTYFLGVRTTQLPMIYAPDSLNIMRLCTPNTAKIVSYSDKWQVFEVVPSLCQVL